MFGYIMINKPELKVREYDCYQSYYCGLCKELQARHGLTGRIGLSYDMNFLVLLLTGLYEPKIMKAKQNCVLHPLTRQTCRKNCFTAYAADMNVLLMYYKCQDDWHDERKYGKAVYGKVLEKNMRSLRARYPEKIREMDAILRELNEQEDREETDIDKMSGYFGKLLGVVFAYQKDVWEDELYWIGFYLGKFIYLCDAYEDVFEDEKKGRYNPFQTLYREKDFDEKCEKMMTMMIAECCRVFETLPILKNAEILRNILYAGVWQRFEAVKSKRAKGKESVK